MVGGVDLEAPVLAADCDSNGLDFRMLPRQASNSGLRLPIVRRIISVIMNALIPSGREGGSSLLVGKYLMDLVN